MKALLINPYIPLEIVYGKQSKDIGAVLPPLGIFYLASYLKSLNKHEVEVLDANALKMTSEKVLEHISRGNYNCIGFTSTTLAYPYAVESAKLIKENLKDITLIIGGPHVQGNSDNILADNPYLFDYICYGEGEFAFESLLDYLDRKIEKEALIGWKYLDNNNIVTAPAADIPANLDLFGHPSEIIPKELVPLYHEKIFAYKKLPLFSIMSSRGCPFRCTFCSTPRKFKNLYNGQVRFHSIDWIIKELFILKEKFGVKEVIFVDDTFNLKINRVMEFCETKIKNNLNLVWSCNFEANFANRDMMQKMKKAGCWSIMVGGESGSDKILKFIKKGVTSSQLLAVGKWANEVGISTRVSFILGLPTDTEETINHTLDFVRKSDFHFPYFQLYIPLPGTEMFDQLEQYGKVVKKDDKHKSANEVNYIPEGLTEESLLKLAKKAHKRTYLRWKMVKNHIKFIRSFQDIVRYLRGFKALINL